ncbi:MAG: nuclear transport factor 2 family protein [Actinomycetota bacterium]
MAELQLAKRVVLDYYADLAIAGVDDVASVLRKHTTDDYAWRGMHPFYEQEGADAVADAFWIPTLEAFAPLQRRPDVFLAGESVVDDGDPAVWVCEMGHLLGLFDRPWLGIPPTRKMVFLRYAEFHRVVGGQIAETALFVDVLSVMRQAGHYPLPPQTGSSHVYPGPATHDGLLFEPQDPAEGAATIDLVHRMVAELSKANDEADLHGDRMPREVLARTWHDDMIWSGPEGIGATYTIDRYQQQHQYPFRMNLTGKRFNGHIARFAEGDYACFFGWANLTNQPTGGFLGLPASNAADMRVVDVYRRDGDKLAENWIFIDLLHWLDMQGLDVLARMRQLTGQEEL